MSVRSETPFHSGVGTLGHRISPFAAALAALLCLAGIQASEAAANPTYGVMNAPEGVYWRSEPNWAAAERISGFGVYNGTIVEIHCYQSGTTVEGSADTMWEQATDVGGPGYGSGWLNEHFINDGQPINQHSPGVPPCQSASAPPPASPPPSSPPTSSPPPPGPAAESGGPPRTRSVFYSGTNTPNGVSGIEAGDLNLPYDLWRGGSSCSPSSAANIPGGVEILAGWSKGRLGPIYFLEAARSRWSSIHWILLFDPGRAGEMRGNCDERVRPSINSLLANWLKSNPANHLVVLTGWVSEEKNSSGHSVFGGLWHYYFAGIWNKPFANQALVCDYNNLSHEEVIRRFSWDIQNPLVGCPNAPSVPRPTAWHP